MSKRDDEMFKDAERSLIGSLILSVVECPYMIEQVRDSIKPSDYTCHKCAVAYKGMTEVFDRDGAWDIVTLAAYLRDVGKYDEVGGSEFLLGCADLVPVAINAPYYAKQVKEMSDRRRLVELCQKTINNVNMGGIDAKILSDDLNLKISSIHGRQLDPKTYSIGEAADEYLLESDPSDTGSKRFIPTGFNAIDREILGFFLGDSIILGARPSMGKSALAMNIAFNMAAGGAPVGFFSSEMSRKMIAMRALSSRSGVNNYYINSNKLREHEVAGIRRANTELHDLPLYIDDQTKLTIQSIRSRTRRMVERYGVQVIFIDYLQHLRWPSSCRSEYDAVTEISGEAKLIAQDMNVAVCSLSQLSRYERAGPKVPPELSHLKSSGAIEQDADVVLMLHTPSKYNSTIRPGESDLYIRKQRNGATGDVTLGWSETTTTFSDLDLSYRVSDDRYF